MAENSNGWEEVPVNNSNDGWEEVPVTSEKKNSVPSVTAPSVSTSESVSGGLGGIEPSMDNLRPQVASETPQAKSQRLNAALTPNARAQKNYIVAKTKHDELIANPNANPIDLDQSAKQLDYFQSRLEKPSDNRTNLDVVEDEAAGILAKLGVGFDNTIVQPLAGATKVIENITGMKRGGAFDVEHETLQKLGEKYQPKTTAGQVIGGVVEAAPLIATVAYTGAAKLPLVLMTTEGLNAVDEGKPFIEGGLQGYTQGLNIEAMGLVGRSFGGAIAKQYNLGQVGEKAATAVGMGAAFSVPAITERSLAEKGINLQKEDLISAATGAAFEAVPFYNAVRGAIKEKNIEKAQTLQEIDAYNTVFQAPNEIVKNILENPKTSKELYSDALELSDKENPTKEDKIAFQTLTRTAGIKQLVETIIKNPEAAKAEIAKPETNLSPEQKTQFTQRIDEINRNFNPIEVKKNELSNTITQLEDVVNNVGVGNNPIEKAENKILADKAKAELEKANSDLEKIVAKQIDEKIRLQSEANLQPQVEVTPPAKIEGVGEGAEAEAKKADIERRRKEELFDILSEEDKQIALKIPEGDKRNKWVKTRVSKTTKGNDAIERHNAEDALNTSTDVATRIAAKRKLESNQPFNAGSISDINNVIFKIKNDDVLIGSEKLIKDYYDAELKALEQKQSTETKVEASNTSNVEEGSVGVGGDVVKPTFENVPILTRTAEEIETAKNEVFNNLNRLEVGSVIENSDGEIKVVTEKSTDKKGNQLIGIVTYERQSDGSLRQMTNIVWASKSADGKIKLDYNPHSTGTNLKGERVTVTDQITDKKIDLSKENIFTEDENGNLIQINKVEPSLKETTKTETPTPKANTSNVGVEEGSVGVGGDVKSTAKALEDLSKNKTERFYPDDKVILTTKDGKEVEVSFRGYNGEKKAVIFGSRGSGINQMEVDLSQLRAKNKSDKLTKDERKNLLSKIDFQDKEAPAYNEDFTDKELQDLSVRYPKRDKLSNKEKNDFNDFQIATTPLKKWQEQEYGVDDPLDPTNIKLAKEHETAINNIINNDKFSTLLAEAYHKAKKDGTNPELVKAVEQSLKETPKAETPKVESKEGFTEGKDLNKMFTDLKSKYGDKKGSALYEVANRLVNPNKNTIVEIRGNGVVVKEGENYILKPFGNTDANSKKWTLYKGIDVTDQFAKSETPKAGSVGVGGDAKSEFTDVGYMAARKKADGILENKKEATPIIGIRNAGSGSGVFVPFRIVKDEWIDSETTKREEGETFIYDEVNDKYYNVKDFSKSELDFLTDRDNFGEQSLKETTKAETPSTEQKIGFTKERLNEADMPKFASDKEADTNGKASAEKTTEITDSEYSDFIDNGNVSNELLNSIAEKVKNRKELSDREKEVFADKTSEINEIIKQSEAPPKTKKSSESKNRERGNESDNEVKPPEPPKKEGDEPNFGGIKNKDTAKTRESLGMEEYEGRVGSKEEAKIQAKKWIADGGDVQVVVDKMNNGEMLSLMESAVLGEYKNSLEKSYEKTQDAETLTKLKELIQSFEKSGNLWAETGIGRQIVSEMQDNLSSFVMSAEKSKGRELTEEEVATETNAYKDLKAAKEALEKQMEEERVQHARDIAEMGINKARAKNKSDVKKTHAEYVAERKKLVEGAKEALKKLRSQTNVSVAPLLNEIRVLAPFIKEAAKTYANESFDKLDTIVTNLHAEFKDLIEGLTKKDVMDVLAGVHDVKKETKPVKLNKLKVLKREIDLLNKIAKERKQEANTPVKRAEKTARIKELEKKLAEVKKANRLKYIELDEAPIDRGLGVKKNRTPEQIEADKIKSIQKRINELLTDIKDENYLKEEPKQAPFKFSRKVLDLQDQKIALEKTIQLRRFNDEQAKRNEWAKIGIELLNAQRVAQTAFDWSVMGRQLAPITFNLRYLPETVKIFKAQKNSTFSVENFDRLMDDIHKGELYHEAVQDGIIYNDLYTGNKEHQNEEYGKSFLYKAPLIGKGLEASNRAADAALNTARAELYAKKTKQLQDAGYFRDTHPEEYKAMANLVMNLTGRGKLLKGLENKAMKSVISTTFFGANLMASRFNIINPKNYIDWKALNPLSEKQFKEYDPVKQQAIKDIVGFTSGVGVLALAAMAGGASISLDPDDPDFLQFTWDDKHYDFTGGIAPYIRTALRWMEGAASVAAIYLGAKEDRDELEKKAKQKMNFAFNSTSRFIRNKYAPNVAYGTNFFYRENTIGEAFNPIDIAKHYPIYVDDFIDAMKEDGMSSIGTVLAPNLVGIGQSSYGTKGNSYFEEREEVPQLLKIKSIFGAKEYSRKPITDDTYFINNEKVKLSKEKVKEINNKVSAVAEKIIASDPKVKTSSKIANGELKYKETPLSELDAETFKKEVDKIYTKSKSDVLKFMYKDKVISQEKKTDAEWKMIENEKKYKKIYEN